MVILVESSLNLQKITEDDKQKENKELWTTWFKSYTDRLKKEVEGETDIEAANQRRKEVMNGTNPRLVMSDKCSE